MNIKEIEFEDKVYNRFLKAITINDRGCWIYDGNRPHGAGYQRIKIKEKCTGVHRYSYGVHKGEIPKGLTIDHLCRVRNCCNPDHLEAVILLENIKRGDSIPNLYRIRATKTLKERQDSMRAAQKIGVEKKRLGKVMAELEKNRKTFA